MLHHLADAKKRVFAAGEFCLEASGFYCTVEMMDRIRDCCIFELILPESSGATTGHTMTWRGTPTLSCCLASIVDQQSCVRGDERGGLQTKSR